MARRKASRMDATRASRSQHARNAISSSRRARYRRPLGFELQQCFAGRPNHYIKGVLQSDTMPEADENKYVWASNKPPNLRFWGDEDLTKCPITSIMNCDNTHEIYSFHPTGAVFAFGDGRVEFVSDTIDINVFVSTFTRAANDIVSFK